MALSKETISSIAGLLGTTAEDITAKITSEDEVTLEIPKGQIFTDDELSRRDSSKYKEGKDAGTEMLVKDLKKKYGYEIEGKDAEAFLSHHENQLKDKYSKGSTDRVKELESDIEKMKKANQSELEAVQNQLSTYKQKSKMQAVKNDLLSVMPSETTIAKDDVLTLFLSKHEIKEDEQGQTYLTANGQPLKDEKTASYIGIQDVFNEFVSPYKKAPSGRGRGNENGGGNSVYTAKDPQAFQDEWQKKNPDKSTAGQDYDKDYAEWRKNQKASD